MGVLRGFQKLFLILTSRMVQRRGYLMFLIRSAFWLVLLVALVPSDPGEQARMYQTASYAVHQAATFCDRNGATCAQAQFYWAMFKEKAAVGARMAADLVNERVRRPESSSSPSSALEQPQSAVQPSERTPEWRSRVKTHL